MKKLKRPDMKKPIDAALSALCNAAEKVLEKCESFVGQVTMLHRLVGFLLLFVAYTIAVEINQLINYEGYEKMFVQKLAPLFIYLVFLGVREHVKRLRAEKAPEKIEEKQT